MSCLCINLDTDMDDAIRVHKVRSVRAWHAIQI